MLPRTFASIVSLSLALGALACHQRPALTTPASDQATYAALYPERLRELRQRFAEDEGAARASFDGLRALPSSAPASSADELEQLVRRADAAGRSQPYVDEALRQEDVAALMSENKSAIRRRVAGSVAATAKELQKEQECLKDEAIDSLAGSAASATDRSVNRQLAQRLRERNPAWHYLRAHADDLGNERVNALEKQVDALAHASFLSNVRLGLYRRELEDLLEHQKAVRTTLERDEAEARAALASEGLSKSSRLALEEQVSRDEAARGALDGEVAASRDAERDLETRAGTLQKDYQALVDALLLELGARQKSATEAAPGSKPAEPGKQPAEPSKS